MWGRHTYSSSEVSYCEEMQRLKDYIADGNPGGSVQKTKSIKCGFPAVKSSDKGENNFKRVKNKVKRKERGRKWVKRVIPADKLHKYKPPETLKKTESLEDVKNLS